MKLRNSGRRWIRTTEGINQQIYSLPHLATLVFALFATAKLANSHDTCKSPPSFLHLFAHPPSPNSRRLGWDTARRVRRQSLQHNNIPACRHSDTARRVPTLLCAVSLLLRREYVKVTAAGGISRRKIVPLHFIATTDYHT